MARKVLVTGGVRSGKSFHAETLLLGEPAVTYVAPGPTLEEEPDPEWRSRVESHRQRRPAHWTTLETRDLVTAIEQTSGALIVDCLGTWLTALIDERNGWDAVREDWEPGLLRHIDEVARVWGQSESTLVAVTNEVGAGIVPERRSGRLFRDLLGIVNQRIAAVSDDVLLVVAGRAITL